MNIQTFYLGSLMTHCYLVWNENREAYLFDCGGENIGRVETFLKTHELTLKYMVLTHGHGDHIGGLNRIKEIFPDVTVYIGKEEEKFLTEPELNLMRYMNGKDFIYDGDYITIKEGDMVGEFEVLDTPGHTIGSKCFYNVKEKMLISGDTMFKRSFGRYDLPTSDGEMLFNSLRKLCTLPEDTKVYSGHSEPTTIGEERAFLTMQGMI
ncbi:hydroxyacylglutathione hydrolase [Fusobacterium necrogenes]|uniref:Hydroxyacylglutathione hydrolase n=1 Tax=Fusobacterium necrogenes TaxID=858 RepID=A0A377GWZ5_9FUSO|nr:MBL fold metallo-hydrolase [Fusobacterium necrogenes]STO31134.1 hydroxyacylglutathione hydrolase [Fusobacterium necrogenes]